MKPRISTVITDLDDTLWDWVGIWHRCFSAMLDELVRKSAIPRESLIEEFKAIHQRYGTAEYSYAIEELPSLRHKHPNGNLRHIYAEAIAAYRTARVDVLRPYPGVMHTLVSLRRRGCTIIGYTESMQFYTNFRLKSIGLDGVLDYLYSPPDHDIPDSAKENGNIAFSDAKMLEWTIQKFTPAGELKPNPDILRSIIEETGAEQSTTIYIGDKLSKDIVMARDAGVISVWAKYGESHAKAEYDLLKMVTHWTPEMVQRERDIRLEEAHPDVVLDKGFSQLLDHFEFVSQIPRTEAHLGHLLAIWEKTIDVQQHFNDLGLRIRNYALTVVAALLALAGLALKEHWIVQVGPKVFPLALPIVVTSGLLWFAFYLMDRVWYHNLLYGSVRHGMHVENVIMRWVPEVNLTHAIGKASPSKILGFTIHSRHKMDIFYLSILVGLVVLGFAVLFGEVAPASTPSSSAIDAQESDSQTVCDTSSMTSKSTASDSGSRLDSTFIGPR